MEKICLVTGAKKGIGFSIASIGFPAVIVPINAIVAISSSFSKYSLGTNNSKVLFFDLSFFM